MKHNILKIFGLISLFFLPAFFTACGPSAKQREQQAKEDSIRLDRERQELLERAGTMIDSVKVELPDTL
ncbi:MAG: hypothetical protein RBS53_00490 [Bacteroidales bacterium]|jgi:hypothetical protein|nr:hypothetical protein [Bacteroidales bacterium]NLM92461.1 hypothetical protein [Bacteroidales bacterium]